MSKEFSIKKEMSKSEDHLSHRTLLTLAIVFSWVLWVVVDFSTYSQLRGWSLAKELISDFAEQLVETTVLLELSLLYIRGIVRLFWKSKRTLMNLIGQVMILAILNGISSVLMANLYEFLFPNQEGLFSKIVFTDYLNLSVLTTAYLIVFLMNRYRKEEERRMDAENNLKEEEIILLKTHLKNLSLQTNNHFVFNCFSTLSGLIRTDVDSAESFLLGMSSMYRYIVSNGNKSVVPIKDEIAFVQDYVNLIRFRYSGVFVSLDERVSNVNGLICPISLQSLVENAVKHNRHGKGNRLEIDISQEDGYVIVTNNRLPREDSVPGTGNGLATLKERYSFLTDKSVITSETDARFEVRIPILYLEDLRDESINN